MPIYEYSCSNCGHYLTRLQKFNEAALVDCPACGGSKLRKLISAAKFQLKGTGWYVTDFRNPPTKQKDKETAKNTQGDKNIATKEAETKDIKNKEKTEEKREAKRSNAEEKGEVKKPSADSSDAQSDNTR